ncbi:hypothetical protein [Desulfurobacterium sp.]
MGLNLAEIQQKLDRLIQNMSEQNRRAYQIFYDPNPQDVELPQLDENGNLVNVTIPNRAKILADFKTWKEETRREFPFINILFNPYMSDTDGDGNLDSPLPGYVAGDYSIEENTVYAWNDSSLPDVVKQAFYEIDAVYEHEPCSAPCQCCLVPFNVQKFAFSGTDYDSGRATFMPGNSVKGKVSFGALAIVTTTGNINVEGIGDLEPNIVYKYVVFRNGEDRNWNIDVPTIKVQGTADIWVIGPWMVPGKFTDAPGVDKGHPLFVHPAGNYIVK